MAKGQVITQVQRWQTPDGNEFTTENEAIAHDWTVNVLKLVPKFIIDNKSNNQLYNVLKHLFNQGYIVPTVKVPD